MKTALSPEFADTRDGQESAEILRKCVHCGFCTATCPTYQLLGDELDGPRGRIYLMKQALEGGELTRRTQVHLDRCLTCRSCETTCPSGVRYADLLSIGRRVVDRRVPRPYGERALRWLLREGLTSPLFAPAVRLGQWLRPLLPGAWQRRLPRPAGARAHLRPTRAQPRKVLLLAGCVQPALLPNINAATARVLDAAGITTLIAESAGCCGAIRLHLGDEAGARRDMRRNIDAWWPFVASGAVEAIVINAAGCGVTVKEYGHALADDADYADKAKRISALTRDLGELLPELALALRDRITPPTGKALAYHPPCTLQHGQQLRGGVETELARLGFDIRLARSESHLCCGSAGTYSILQPALANELRERKLAHLSALHPDCIVTANVGCILHLQAGSAIPVQHWVEVLDQALAQG